MTNDLAGSPDKPEAPIEKRDQAVLYSLYEAAQPSDPPSQRFRASDPFEAEVWREGEQVHVKLHPEDEEDLATLLEMNSVEEGETRSKIGFQLIDEDEKVHLAIQRGALWSQAAHILIESNE